MIEIQPIQAAQTHALRRAILRPNRPLQDSIYPKDDAPEALHLGAIKAGEIVGIASIYPESWPLEADSSAYRLRGMAVDPRVRRMGIGAALVHECLSQIKARGSAMLWCNARTSALEFYLSLGFESVGEAFEIAGIGPHFLMRCDVA